MNCTRLVTSDIYYVGSSDRRLALFESVYPIPRGVSYNSYLILDEKTVLLDTVDRSVSTVFFENIKALLDGRKLDYVIVNHMEPDHAATLSELRLRYPEATFVATQKAVDMMGQFFESTTATPFMAVKEGDSLCTGRHNFTFVTAPMVHWPEVMVSYDSTDKVLFSADAFGTFGALSGNIFADEYDFERDWLDDARRYYTNIVGKYGVQVQNLLKKAGGLDIKFICPLHGPIWRKDIAWFIDKYDKWSSYTPEGKSVLIAYASVYGDTENAANILATELAENGVRNIAMYDVSTVHPSVIVSEAFRCSHLVFAATTYNMGIFVNMEIALNDIKAHNLQNRKVAILENGSWAPASGKLMRELISSMKNMTIIEQSTTLKSSVKAQNVDDIKAMAKALAVDLV
ncbi:MAG: FprA family A-type flavoprotein [Spirochaetales bacterium]